MTIAVTTRSAIPGQRQLTPAARIDAEATDAPGRDAMVQYGRRIEADRSWTVYHVFTGVPARDDDRSMTGLSRSGATKRMLTLNQAEAARCGPRRRASAPHHV